MSATSAANCDLPELPERDAGPVDEKWTGIKAEVLTFAWTLYLMMGVDPAEILRAAAERLTKDDKSRLATRLFAEEVRAELERLILEEPMKKRAVLLARIAEDLEDPTGRSMKYETLRDILARPKEHRPAFFHYVRDPEKKLPIWAVIDAAEKAEEEKRRGTPPHTTPSRGEETASRLLLNGDAQPREGEAEHGETNFDRGRRRAGTAPAANAPKSAEQRRRLRSRRARSEPRGVSARGSREVDRVPTPPLDPRPRPRSRGVRKRPPP